MTALRRLEDSVSASASSEGETVFGRPTRPAWMEEEEEVNNAGNDSDSEEEETPAIGGRDMRWLAEGSWDILSGEVDSALKH